MAEDQKLDYSQTVHLPRTEFPMKAGLAEREPKQLQAWDQAQAYQQLRQLRAGAKKWVLHDGPPFANGDIHMGHALNKTLKDFCVRFRSMQGMDAPFVPGWDCHGLPIESKVSRNWPKDEPKTPLKIRQRCRQEAELWISKQKEEFKRLGVWGDWMQPYITMDKEFEAAQLDIYWKLLQSGQIYRGLKPVHWCIFDQTALADAELEYAPHESQAIFVKFSLEPASAARLGLEAGKAFVVIWTTTPWTLPANLGVAVHAQYNYAAYPVDGEAWILAEDLAGGLFEKLKLPVPAKKLWAGKGSGLEGLKYRNPLPDVLRPEPAYQVVLAPYVTLDAGTGLVHTAPGHGVEDYSTGVRYKLEIFNPVDDQGRYDQSVGLAALQGKRVTDKETNFEIIELLKAKGVLVLQETLQHSYPHCWRCKNPIIFRATEQWFMSLEQNGLREKTLAEIDKAQWINPWGRERLSNMVRERADWCISRQRAWGVPIYMYYCASCHEPHFDQACYEKLKTLVAQKGSDVWFEQEAAALLPQGAKCAACGSTQLKKETDILDVWFDSGSSHAAVLRQRKDLQFPADLYLEGSDQYRGWFQSSLLVAMGFEGRAPYRAVVSHGWVLDEKGRAMHKSLGNVVDPLKMIEKYGADILRLWAASENFMEDLSLGDELLKRIADSYRRLRNTFRWLLGNLDSFDPKKDSLALEQLQPLDRWLLGQLNELIENCTKHMEAYEFQRFTAQYVQFCAVQLSSFVFDVHKDTLYTLAKNAPQRLSAQTVFYQVLQALVRLGAPVLAFTCEEVWAAMPAAWKDQASVHHATWPQVNAAWNQGELKEEFQLLLDVVRPAVSKKLEEARAAKLIGHPYDAEINISAHSKRLYKLLMKYESMLPMFFVVSKVSVAPAAPQDGIALNAEEITVSASRAAKCERCWRRPGDVGKHAEHPSLCERCIQSLP